MTIPVDFAQVSLEYTGAGVPHGAFNVFGVEPDVTLAGDPVAIGAAVAQAVDDASFDGVWTIDTTLSNINVKCGPDDTGASADTPTVFVGDSGDPAAPPNVSLLAKKVTLLGGREGRGRMYTPSPPENIITAGGQLTGPGFTGLAPVFADFLTALETNLVPMVILHEDPLLAPSTVTALILSTTVATQRRRLRP